MKALLNQVIHFLPCVYIILAYDDGGDGGVVSSGDNGSGQQNAGGDGGDKSVQNMEDTPTSEIGVEQPREDGGVEQQRENEGVERQR